MDSRVNDILGELYAALNDVVRLTRAATRIDLWRESHAGEISHYAADEGIAADPVGVDPGADPVAVPGATTAVERLRGVGADDYAMQVLARQHDIVSMAAWLREVIRSRPTAGATMRDRTPSPDGKAARRSMWLAHAMLQVRDNPEWSDSQIAKSVGKSPSTLTRSREYQAAAAIARGARSDVLRGFTTTGGIESYGGDADLDD